MTQGPDRKIINRQNFVTDIFMKFVGLLDMHPDQSLNFFKMLRTLTSLDGVLEYGTLMYDKILGVFTIHVNLFSSMLSYQYDRKIFTSVSYLAE